jgi:hypothetical protein
MLGDFETGYEHGGAFWIRLVFGIGRRKGN